MEDIRADGEMLRTIKESFLKERSFDNLGNVLMCLHDALVLVPCETDVNAEQVAALAENAPVPGEVRFKPDIITDSTGKKYLPVFSTESEVPEKYGRDFILCEDAFRHCFHMARNTADVEGLVLDPYTSAMVLPLDLVATMYQKETGSTAQ